MPRPKRPFNGVEELVYSDDRWLKRQGTRIGTREERRFDASTHWGYRAVNGLYDPLTYLHVLDTVVNIDPDIELRTRALVDFLNVERDQFYWDVITVGRVLADLCDSFATILGEKTSLLERGQDYRGNFYLLHHNAETAALFTKVKRELMKLGEDEMTKRARGERSRELVSPLVDCPSLRGEFAEAV